MDSDTNDDVTLIREAFRGNAKAMDDLVKRLECIPRMLASKNRRLNNPLDLDELNDLIQDSVVSVWKKLPEFAGRSTLETWVCRFCYLEYLYRLRRAKRLPKSLEEIGRRFQEPEAPQPSLDDIDELRVAMTELTEDEREAVELKHFEGKTLEEIGARLGVSTNSVKTRYYRALRKLRERLESQTESKQVRERDQGEEA